MFLWQMAWRNLWRYPKRTALTTSALAITTFTLVFLLSFQLGVYDTMKQQGLRLMDGLAQIQAPEYQQKPNIRRSFELTDALIQSLTLASKQHPDLLWTARAQNFGLLSLEGFNSPGLVLAVNPKTEPQLTHLHQKMVAGRYLQADDANQILLGKALAEQLHAQLGDVVQILSSDRHGSVAADLLEVVGIFDSGIKELDRQLMLMPLSYFQTLFAMPNQVHQVSLVMPKLSQIDAISPQLQQLAQQHNLVFLDGRALQPGLYNGIDLDFYNGMVWYVAILMIVVLILLNTLLMSLLEREREFGLMLSIGLSRGQLAKLVAIETQLTLLLGIGLGVMIGMALVQYYTSVGLTIPGTEELYAEYGLSATLYPALSWFSVLFAPAVLWGGGVMMGAVMTLRLYRLTPLSGRHTL